jgi:hypothetical protein
VLALAAAPLGWRWSSAGQIAALVTVLVAMLVTERKAAAASV